MHNEKKEFKRWLRREKKHVRKVKVRETKKERRKRLDSYKWKERIF